MRKIMAFLMGGLLLLGLSGCSMGGQDTSPAPDTEAGQEDTNVSGTDAGQSDMDVSETDAGQKDTDVPETGSASGAAAESDPESAGSNILIAYFSVPENVSTDGVDAVAGASIVVRDGEKLGNTEYVAKLIQETVGGDLFRIETVDAYPLEHDPLVDQAADEQDAELRPELATHVEAFGKYEYVFLGFPNWWGDMPQPLYTFLEEYDFGAKTVIPFITHGGSGASRTIDTISELQPEALLMGNELVIPRGDVAGSGETVVNWANGLDIHSGQ